MEVPPLMVAPAHASTEKGSRQAARGHMQDAIQSKSAQRNR
jgi:hypothetical protein